MCHRNNCGLRVAIGHRRSAFLVSPMVLAMLWQQGCASREIREIKTPKPLGSLQSPHQFGGIKAVHDIKLAVVPPPLTPSNMGWSSKLQLRPSDSAWGEEGKIRVALIYKREY